MIEFNDDLKITSVIKRRVCFTFTTFEECYVAEKKSNPRSADPDTTKSRDSLQ